MGVEKAQTPSFHGINLNADESDALKYKNFGEIKEAKLIEISAFDPEAKTYCQKHNILE